MKRVVILILLLGSFQTGYSQSCNAPPSGDVTICGGTSAVLSASGEQGEYRWYDSDSDGNLLSTGTVYTTPVLSVSTTYYVEVTTKDCKSSRTPVNAFVRPAPSVSGISICSGSDATLRVTGPGGNYQWYDSLSGGRLLQSGPNYTTPVLTTTTTYYVQTTVDNCTSARTSVTVTVNEKAATPVVSNMIICSGSAATLTATGTGGTYQWFNTPSGGNALISSPDFTTPPLTATTKYYVQATVNGCTSERKEVTITIKPIPPLPVVNDIRICSGISTTLSASGVGGNYTWFGVPFRGDPLGTGETFTTPVLTRSTTYYVESAVNGCNSARTPVTVVVYQVPDPPIAPGQTICIGSSAILTASGSNGTYSWYDMAAGGSLLSTSPGFTTPVLNTNKTYYVQTTLNGCISQRTPVEVKVVQYPAAPIVSDTTLCAGSTVTLFARGSGGVYAWYDAPSGGNLLLINQQYTPPPINSTTTFYVQTTIGECSSARSPVTIKITSLPPAPAVTGLTICAGSSADLTATGGGIYRWYDAASEGTLLMTGSDFKTPNLNSSTTYFVQSTIAGCASARTPVTVSINSVADPGFRYSAATYCKASQVNPRPAIFIPSGGTFSSSPAGLVFISTSSGQIDLNASALGTYTVTFKGNGTCPSSSTGTLTITDNPISFFKFEGPYCQDGENPRSMYPTGGSAGVFSVSPSGLVFTGDGVINLRASLPGNYIITNTIPANGSCTETSSRDTVIILPAPSANAGDDQSVLAGSTLVLSGAVTNTGSFFWSGGKGSFSDSRILNPIYTPGPTEGRVTLYLNAVGTAPCNTITDSLMITFNLSAPIVADAIICSGSTSTLTATGPGGTYQWYDALAGGNLLVTNPTFVTPPLMRSTIYYVQTTIGGTTSPRAAVNVTVNPIPVTPLASGTIICEGTSATLSASASTGVYQWYDDPVSGNLLAATAAFTTPKLSTTTTYYVQSILANCTSARRAVTVTVNPVPRVTSAAIETIWNTT
ncbi:MAG: immunoglobulin domain-containing protein, partial [Daejeonella sp.]